MGKSTINGHFQLLCEFTRGYPACAVPGDVCAWGLQLSEAHHRANPGAVFAHVMTSGLIRV